MFKLQDIDRFNQKICYNYEMNKDLALDYCEIIFNLIDLSLDNISLIISMTNFSSSNRKIISSFNELQGVSRNNTILTCSFQGEYQNVNVCIVVDFHIGILRIIFKNQEDSLVDQIIDKINILDDEPQVQPQNENMFEDLFNTIPDFSETNFYGGY